MKKLILAMAAILALTHVPLANAEGGSQLALQQAWRAQQTRQKIESARFKAIEAEASRSLATTKPERAQTQK